MKLKPQPGIYYIECSISQKKYIGCTINIKSRKGSHFTCLRCKRHNNQKLQRAFNKYGENNFQFNVLEYCEESFLSEREVYWINYFDSVDKGYNILEGGKSGYKMSAKLIKERAVKIKKTYSNKDRTKHHSVKFIFEYTTDGDFVRKWDSIKIASEETDIPYNTLRKCLHGHLKRFKTTMWSFYFRGDKIEPYKRTKGKFI